MQENTKRLFLLLILTFVLFTLSAEAPAYASGVFAPDLRFQIVKGVDNSGAIGNTELTSTVIDLRMAYLFDESGWLLGGLYKLETDQVAAGDTKGFAYGPSVGFTRENLSIIASYILNATRTYTVIGVPKKFTKGRGWQVDFAWTPRIAENFGLGPSITWQSIKYGGSQIGPADETGEGYEEARIVPGLAFWYQF